MKKINFIKVILFGVTLSLNLSAFANLEYHRLVRVTNDTDHIVSVKVTYTSYSLGNPLCPPVTFECIKPEETRKTTHRGTCLVKKITKTTCNRKIADNKFKVKDYHNTWGTSHANFLISPIYNNHMKISGGEILEEKKDLKKPIVQNK